MRAVPAARARAWLAMAVLGLVGVLLLAVFPARALMAQRAERRQVAARISQLDARNGSLDARSAALYTDAEIERLARERYNLVRPNEEVFDVVATDAPPPAAPALRTPAAAPASPGPAPGWLHRVATTLVDIF